MLSFSATRLTVQVPNTNRKLSWDVLSLVVLYQLSPTNSVVISVHTQIYIIIKRIMMKVMRA